MPSPLFRFVLKELFKSHSVLRESFLYQTFIRASEIDWCIAENDPDRPSPAKVATVENEISQAAFILQCKNMKWLE